MIGAAYHRRLPGAIDEANTAMAADIVEDPDNAVPAAHHQQGHVDELNRPKIAGKRQLCADPNAGPAASEELVALETEQLLVDIELVRKACSLSGGAQDGRSVEVESIDLHGRIRS